MIHIEKNVPLDKSVAPVLLKNAARVTLKQQRQPVSANITIVLTDDAHIHALNKEYLKVDAPTDVLSFPADQTDPETGRRYLGDIIISIPYAARQAAKAGHALAAEAQLLVVHGVLHLLGHDHADAAEKARMWEAQGAVLTTLGLSHVQVCED